MESKSKIGVLKYIAKSGAKGCKFEDQPETWYNPATDEAKGMVKDEYVRKRVEIMLVNGKKTEFSSMMLLEAGKKEGEEEVIEEEVIQEEQLDETGEGVPTGASHTEEKGPMNPEEEKEPTHVPVDRDPKVIKETQDQLMSGCGPIEGLLKAAAGAVLSQEYTHDVYSNMEKTKLETAKKGTMGLTYASWSEAWGALKRAHPTATYHVHEDEKTGLPYINDEKLGAFVKVSVKVKGVTHTVHLPVMDHSNKAAKGVLLDVVLINKNIMRCFAKAIAMHGIGLYVFKGEDFP